MRVALALRELESLRSGLLRLPWATERVLSLAFAPRSSIDAVLSFRFRALALQLIVYCLLCRTCIMRPNSDLERMTAAEVSRRLRAIKRSLNNKSQVLLYTDRIHNKFDSLSIDISEAESFYVNPIKFDKAQFFEYLGENKKLFDRTNFMHDDLLNYVSTNKKTLCRNFAVTAMLFVKFRRMDVTQKHVIVCTGSIYHAPRLFYKDVSSDRVTYEKCSEYLDLM